MKIYLAGGMRSGWQDTVIPILKTNGHEIFDPRSHNIKVFEEYSFLDLLRIRQSDVVIGYIELGNPSCMGLAGEIAYAKGLGKTTLLINEKIGDRYTQFTENFADVVFHSFDDSISLIGKM